MSSMPPSPPPPLSVTIPVTSESSLNGGPSPVHIYNEMSHLDLEDGSLLPFFRNEDKAARMTNSHRSKKMRYGKVVDMSYLAQKLTLFFFGASFLLIDLLSDTYYCISLYHDDSYKGVSAGKKMAFLVFLVLSTSLWILSSFLIALSFKNSVGFHDQPTTASKIILLLCLTALVAFDLPMYLLAMPQRTVLVTDIRSETKPPSSPTSPSSRPPLSNSLFLLAYTSRSEWKSSTHYGLFSHLPTFLFEDIPLFIINAQISLSSSISFTSILALVFSLFGILKKGFTIYTFCAEGFASED